MNRSENISELAKALSVMQSQLQPAPKDCENPFFKSHYADLASVWGAIQKPLTDNGFSVAQTVDCDNSPYMLITTLFHASGQWISSRYPLNPVKTDPQSFGACVTYARRYALSAICGVCSIDDDDGNKASETATNARPPITPPQKKVADDIPMGAMPSYKVVADAKEVFDGQEIKTEFADSAKSKKFYAIAKGLKMSNDDIKAYLSGWNIESAWKIPSVIYEELIVDLKSQTGEAKP